MRWFQTWRYGVRSIGAILAKNTAIHYSGPSGGGQPMTINIIDTPGHADGRADAEDQLLRQGC